MAFPAWQGADPGPETGAATPVECAFPAWQGAETGAETPVESAFPAWQWARPGAETGAGTPVESPVPSASPEQLAGTWPPPGCHRAFAQHLALLGQEGVELRQQGQDLTLLGQEGVGRSSAIEPNQAQLKMLQDHDREFWIWVWFSLGEAWSGCQLRLAALPALCLALCFALCHSLAL